MRFLRFFNGVVKWGQMTSGVGVASGTREVEGLATAASKVDCSLGAAPARLGHPVLASEGVHSRGEGPAVIETPLGNRPEFQAGERPGLLAGLDRARWSDDHVLLPPTTHAGLGSPRKMVGKHQHDFWGSAQ